MTASDRLRSPCVLYLSMSPGNLSQGQKLAGIRRYCSTRGWEVRPIGRPDFSSERLPLILEEWQPIGCIVEGIGNTDVPPPGLFGVVPVTYLECPPDIVGNAPNILVDDAAIAREAVRELSAGRPSCYAAVGSLYGHQWARLRLRAFRDAVAAETGKKCAVFPMPSPSSTERFEERLEHLAAWIATLPRNCAIFAASDVIAARVVAAARASRRNIPRDLTLVSTDNHPEICEASDPPISSIQIDLERMGYVAASMLAATIKGRAAPEIKGRAELGIKGRATREMKGAACAANGESFAPKAHPLLTVRRKSTGGRGRHEPWVLDAVAAIRAEACGGLTAGELIDRYPVSKRLFTLRFREATGHSVLDEILHVRLEKAYTLLAQTDTAIGAIPGLCGFRSERTLEALFRDRAGMSMRDWRKTHARP